MFSNLLKNISILKKFLFINLIFFTIIGLFTFAYLKNVQPNLIKKKSSNHIEIINNTIDNLIRLEVTFIEEDIIHMGKRIIRRSNEPHSAPHSAPVNPR